MLVTASQESATLLSQLKPLRTLTPRAFFSFFFFCGNLLEVSFIFYYYFVFRFVGYEIFCILLRFYWIRGSYSSDSDTRGVLYT
jgi:hypothetical protein